VLLQLLKMIFCNTALHLKVMRQMAHLRIGAACIKQISQHIQSTVAQRTLWLRRHDAAKSCYVALKLANLLPKLIRFRLVFFRAS